MFHTIRTCLDGLPRAREWASDSTVDTDAEAPEFSIAPLSYSTEIGEHLYTIPLQLEPYIPDVEDAILASPDGQGEFGLHASLPSRPPPEQHKMSHFSVKLCLRKSERWL